ncbi:hypothetical protein [Paenibacillus swuensis]|uniref:hypothetical protein n=1 Tax=Paenibacillus swuensis TaxID=1178515 RepID=UPI0018D2C8EA|nr:hypothetical protein [Paenibacillus swuensis]
MNRVIEHAGMWGTVRTELVKMALLDVVARRQNMKWTEMIPIAVGGGMEGLYSANQATLGHMTGAVPFDAEHGVPVLHIQQRMLSILCWIR